MGTRRTVTKSGGPPDGGHQGTQEKKALDPLIERGLPMSPEAEKAVLGAILLDQTVIYLAVPLIKSEDFAVDANRRIFAVFEALVEAHTPIDETTVTNQLQKKKELEMVGGVSYLSTLTDGLPRSVNIEHHCRIVKEKSTLRRIIHTAHNIVQEGLDGGYDGTVSEFLGRAQMDLFSIEGQQDERHPVEIGVIITDNFKNIGQPIPIGVPTGFNHFDDLTRGFQPGDFVIIGARPSIGKTAILMDIIRFNGINKKNPCAVFSLEMSKEALTNRVICAEARVDSHKFRSGFLSKDELRAMADAAELINGSPIYIDDTPALSMSQLRAKAMRLKMRHGIKLLGVDYLQLMSPPKAENRNMEVTIISRGLKQLARDLGIPVVALSQLKRPPETRSKEERPSMESLRDSGSLEQDADIIALLHRQEYYLRMRGREVPEEWKGIAEVIIGKQRNGPTETVKLAFLAKYSSFGDMAYQEELF